METTAVIVSCWMNSDPPAPRDFARQTRARPLFWYLAGSEVILSGVRHPYGRYVRYRSSRQREDRTHLRADRRCRARRATRSADPLAAPEAGDLPGRARADLRRRRVQ